MDEIDLPEGPDVDYRDNDLGVENGVGIEDDEDDNDPDRDDDLRIDDDERDDLLAQQELDDFDTTDEHYGFYDGDGDW